MKKWKLCLSLVFVFAVESQGGRLAWAQAREQISDETVPIQLIKGGIECIDGSEDHGFGATHGFLNISGDKVLDKTHRFTEKDVVFFDFSNEITCRSLEAQLKNMPVELSVQRKVYREVVDSQVGQFTIVRLNSEIRIETPLVIAGVKVALVGTQEWNEQNSKKTDKLPPPLPQRSDYSTLTYPQSASNDVGLFCNPSYPEATEYLLSLGEISKEDWPGERKSNVNIVTRTFLNREDCENTRSNLLRYFAAVDPDNAGTLLKVNRNVSSVFRLMRDNQANEICQEVQVDTVAVIVDNLEFGGAKSFAVRNVDFEKCLSQ